MLKNVSASGSHFVKTIDSSGATTALSSLAFFVLSAFWHF
jgi:hypothetical protein